MLAGWSPYVFVVTPVHVNIAFVFGQRALLRQEAAPAHLGEGALVVKGARAFQPRSKVLARDEGGGKPGWLDLRSRKTSASYTGEHDQDGRRRRFTPAWLPSAAVDGVTNYLEKRDDDKHCARAEGISNGTDTQEVWWQVDLGKTFDISRLDVYGSRYSHNIDVLMDERRVATKRLLKEGLNDWPLTMSGRTLKIVGAARRKGWSYLTLCELKVMGVEEEAAPKPSTNINQGKPGWLDLRALRTTQKSTYGKSSGVPLQWTPQHAVDGVAGPDDEQDCAKVDLRKEYDVSRLMVTSLDEHDMKVLMDGKHLSKQFAKRGTNEWPLTTRGRTLRIVGSSRRRDKWGVDLGICDLKVMVYGIKEEEQLDKSSHRKVSTISETGVCEHYWFNLGKLTQSVVKTSCLALNLTFDGCSDCCIKDAACGAFDHFRDTGMCERYVAACPVGNATFTHDGGRSYRVK
eukprot:TRINITY_DN18973_c0_g1_i3.p1 TRINITY_DN18973_c0_g1~~TRINITY_DN18973_c0_g1_i3.p1  ORF type:complete len:459 (-),score=55.85 TRINITY_DN18973_c0_g1_i3:21-1397(-)